MVLNGLGRAVQWKRPVTLTGVWGAFLFHPVLNWAGCLLNLLVCTPVGRPAETSALASVDTGVAPEIPLFLVVM